MSDPGPTQGVQSVRRGFTLIDVLVTMAVIAVLLSLLMPSFTTVRETARQVVCRSNVHQIGLGIYQFAESHEDRIPGTVFTDDPITLNPWRTMTIRRDSGVWDGIGHMYADEYLPAPLIFYCPSHHGTHPYRAYEDQWGGQAGEIIGNFQYRGRGPLNSNPPGQNSPTTDILSSMRPGTALIVDGLRTQGDFNHEVGANIYRADNSVGWFSDRAGAVIAQLPKDTSINVQNSLIDQVWSELDYR